MSTSRFHFVVLLFFILCSETIAGTVPQTYRHFEGARYLSLSNILVYSRPTSSSIIINDIPRWRLIYAKPTANPAWLAVTGTGVREYPDTYKGGHGDKVGILKNGRFALTEERVDRDDYYKVVGFVEARLLGNMDSPARLPKEITKVTKVLSLWDATGVQERRFAPNDADLHPFSAIVGIASQRSDGTASNDFCSGFFIESKRLVGSAGHCFTEENRKNILVRVPSKSGRDEWIPAVLKDHSFDLYSSHSRDWAVLELTHEPQKNIMPLHLLSEGNWLKSGRVQALVLGFGADLKQVIIKQFGSNIVHGDVCEVPLSLINLNILKNGSRWLSTVSSGLDCISTNGDSGGPLIIWNGSRARYEIIGITSWGKDAFPINLLDEPATELYRRTVQQIENTYGPSNKFDKPHGSAALAKLASMSTGYFYDKAGWLLNEEFFDTVAAAIGTDRSAGQIFQLLAQDGIGVMSSQPGLQSKGFTLNIRRDLTIDAARKSAFNGPFAKNTWLPKYQQKVSLNGILDIADLKRQGVPHQVYAPIMFTSKYIFDSKLELVPTKDIQAAKRTLHEASKKFDPESLIVKTLIPADLDVLETLRVVEVGGDLYVLDTATGRVKELYRNWMNYLDGDLEMVRSFEFYNRELEKPPKGPLRKPTSDIEPTTKLRTARFGDQTPAMVPGGSTITPVMAWQDILKGLRGQGQGPLVLSAITDFNGVPTAIDVSFAATGGDYQDSIQTRLSETLKRMGIPKKRPIITYCHRTECWLSYNLALRLIQLGYSDVRWMRNGMDGWIDSGLPMGFVRHPEEISKQAPK